MTTDTLIMASGLFGTSLMMLAQTVPGADLQVPWSSLVGQGGVIVAMGIGLRYTTLRQRDAELAQNVARDAHITSVKTIYESHNQQLVKLLEEEKEEGRVDRELFKAAIDNFTQALRKLEQ